MYLNVKNLQVIGSHISTQASFILTSEYLTLTVVIWTRWGFMKIGTQITEGK